MYRLEGIYASAARCCCDALGGFIIRVIWLGARLRAQSVAEIVCAECGYRISVVRTPQSGKPEHDLDEFQRLCREGPFETLAATGCVYLDSAYMDASRRREF